MTAYVSLYSIMWLLWDGFTSHDREKHLGFIHSVNLNLCTRDKNSSIYRRDNILYVRSAAGKSFFPQSVQLWWNFSIFAFLKLWILL